MKPKSGSKDAIHAARKRLEAAKKWEASAAQMLKSARDEVREAQLFLQNMERMCHHSTSSSSDGSGVNGADSFQQFNHQDNNVLIEVAEDCDLRMNNNHHSVNPRSQQQQQQRRGKANQTDDDDSISDLCGYHINVFGCGLMEINGDYRCCGTCDDVPMFRKDDFMIFRCMISNGTRRWFLSKVPRGVQPGTSQDVDFYISSTHASTVTSPTNNAANDFNCIVPPKYDWVVINNRAGQIDRQGGLVVVTYNDQNSRMMQHNHIRQQHNAS